ncbi:uncharacterized protein LOC116181746 [Photinus pyralis]|uniref:uncharacterized protein LOC116181746 n=1 Tax=Photinus pyralis TaxID=7054 RepID=UPI0012672023|nr:uncharacterized protein LOC116181746 [Photinus pyralis]
MNHGKLLWIFLTVPWPYPFGECFYNYASEEKELVYDYSATISATTNVSDRYASQSFLNGKLHIQRMANTLFVRLSSLTMKLYNGALKGEYEDILDELPIPTEYEDLLRIFQIDYDATGQVAGISTEMRELTPARNIKKAIASILQIDIRSKNESCKFQAEEFLISGKVTVSYTVSNSSDQILIRKESHIDEWIDGHGVHKNEQKYTIGEGFVEKIEATELITFSPTLLNVTQTLTLDGIEPISERYQLHQEFSETTLMHTVNELASFGGAKEYHDRGFEATVSSTYNEIKSLSLDMDSNGLGALEETLKRGVSIENILRLLRSFSVDGLAKFYVKLKEWSFDSKNQLEIFHQLLPYTGNRASTALIVQLVLTRATDEETAVEMLKHLPLNVAIHNEQDLEDLSSLLNLGSEFGEDLQMTAVLCFSNMIATSPNSSSSYVEDLVGRFQSSTDYDNQLLYLTAILNTGKADSRHLISVIQGDGYEVKLRLAAIWAVTSVDSDKSEINEILRSVLTNTSEPYEIRGAAHFAMTHRNDTESLFAQELSNYYEYSGGMKLKTITLRSFTYLDFQFHSQMTSLHPYALTVYAHEAMFSGRSLTIADVHEAKFDLIFRQGCHVVQISSCNLFNLKKIKSIFTLTDPKSVRINYNVYKQRSLGTSLGIPGAADLLESVFYQNEGKVAYTRTNNEYNIVVARQYRISKNLQRGMRFFNPIADIWQEVKSYNISRDELLLEAKLDVVQVGKSANVSLQVRINATGLAHRSLEAVYVNAGVFYSEILSKTCETCRSWVNIEQ